MKNWRTMFQRPADWELGRVVTFEGDKYRVVRRTVTSPNDDPMLGDTFDGSIKVTLELAPLDERYENREVIAVGR